MHFLKPKARALILSFSPNSVKHEIILWYKKVKIGHITINCGKHHILLH